MAIFVGYWSFAGIFFFFLEGEGGGGVCGGGVSLSKLNIFRVYQNTQFFLWGIVRIGVRTFCLTDSCFYLALTALFLLCISSIPLQ